MPEAKDTDLITRATDIRMRAERRAGELLREMAERKERDSGRGNRNPVLKSQAAIPKLADLGVTKTQSSRWQNLAALPAATFEDKVAAASKCAYDRITGRFLKEAEIKRAQEQHRRTIEHGCTVTDLVSLAESGKRFPVIYADLPLSYRVWSPERSHSHVEHHYGTSTVEQIKALPVERLAADDCVRLRARSSRVGASPTRPTPSYG
jgi:hypothetical protein